MYYKIENKECEVYKKLHEFRLQELQIEKDNLEAIKKKINIKFENFYGYRGQICFQRINQYAGFEFTELDKIDHKIWNRLKENLNIFIPNKRTKQGRDISNFLSNELKSSSFFKLRNLLGLETNRNMKFPFLDIENDVIILYLDDKVEIKDENIIEITKKMFDHLRGLN